MLFQFRTSFWLKLPKVAIPAWLGWIMTRRRIFSSWGLLLLFFTPAQKQLDGAQIRGGTAIVMLFSKGDIVFAAESRVVLAGKNIRYRDDACKVRAIKNKFIFASAGVNGFEPDPGENGNAWSAYDEPGQLAGLIPDTADDPVNLLAELWGKSVEQRVNRALVVNPGPMMHFLQVDGGETLTTGTFGGRTRQGKFVMYRAVLDCDCTAKSKHALLTILPVSLPDHRAATVIGTKEALALWDELVNEKSERARVSTDKFGADHAGMRGPDLLGATAVAGLEFVLKYAQSGDIGGPIDAVEMTSSGDIHWIQRKANCPDQR
jgi:hypothetical protein